MSSNSSKPTRSSSAKTAYLTAYNGISCILWATILGRTVNTLVTTGDYNSLYAYTGEFVKWSQTAAMMEIGHSLFGVVRAPVFTTAMQVASRFLLVWGIADQFPSVPANSVAYSTMLLAWSATEVIRYSYFVFFLNGNVPGVLQWLRYNTFFLLYPMGISSEMWLVYKAAGPAAKRDERLPYVLYGILGLYVPGAYILYTHMMTQRRRVLRGKAKAR